jgi:hypothetical protein
METIKFDIDKNSIIIIVIFVVDQFPFCIVLLFNLILFHFILVWFSLV